MLVKFSKYNWKLSENSYLLRVWFQVEFCFKWRPFWTPSLIYQHCESNLWMLDTRVALESRRLFMLQENYTVYCNWILLVNSSIISALSCKIWRKYLWYWNSCTHVTSYRSGPPAHAIWITKDVGKFTIITSMVVSTIIYQ